uniref:WD repeat, SAM and U-box domain-containing protein 1 n=1 Tax=Timema cristinae TaxID=61476 RepID=A0A7R9GXR8_TIMCR|nr:unnamed protein product [Timema cristinae]
MVSPVLDSLPEELCLQQLLSTAPPFSGILGTFQEHEGTIQAVSFTPDSSFLVTTCTLGVMKLWALSDQWDNSTANRCLYSVDDAHDLGVMSSDFSPVQEINEDDSSLCHRYLLATCGNDHLVKVWLLVVGQFLKHLQSQPCELTLHMSLEGHTSAVTCVKFSAGGNYLASAGLDKTVRLWEMGGSCVSVLEGHSRYVACCCFSRDGILLASGSNDKSLVVWDLAGNLTLDSELVKPCSALSHFGNNNKECSQLYEQEAATSDGNDVKLLQRLDQHGASVNSCDFHGNNMLASAASDKFVRLFVRSEEGRFEESEFSPLEGHSYSVNKVEFSPSGNLMASCSLDGTAVLWDIQSGSQIGPSVQCNSGGLRACRFSPDGHLLVTAGDDDKASIWNTHSLDQLMCMEGHADAVVAAAFTPDSQYVATTSSDETVKLWCVAPCSEVCLLNQEETHDLGAQSCDFSPAEGNTAGDSLNTRRYRYLLATCGNDSLVKLWHISAYPDEPNATSDLWRTLSGHGGNVMCVRFSPVTGELLASTATDKTARLWNVVLTALSLANKTRLTDAFDCVTTGVGSMDKNIIVWELPQQLVFQSVATGRLRTNQKKLLEWSTEEVIHWLTDIGLEELVEKARQANITGHQFLTLSNEDLLALLDFEEEELAQKLCLHVYWLRRDDVGVTEVPSDVQLPHEFLCPITHEIMRDPVVCTDGFTYERAAINEWFLSGKFTSPMTNATLTDTTCASNTTLRSSIYQFLYGDDIP